MQLRVEYVQVDDLREYGKNARTHSVEQVAQLVDSIREFGFTNPILIDEAGELIAGHGRLAAARTLGMDEVPAIRLTNLTETQKKALRIADNQLALNAGWDLDLLADEIRDLDLEGFDLETLGFTDEYLADLLDGSLGDGDGASAGEEGPGDWAKGSLADRFLVAPFSVLNAREGWWQDRKRAWIDLGIRSEIGRGDNVLQFSRQARSGYAKTYGTEGNASEMSGTSIFDPVLCELVYRWFSPSGGMVLDPFAGGSVRGIVAAKLGRQYVGHELRGEQVQANRDQAAKICGGDQIVPTWIEGDSRRLDETCADVKADLIFSCPPYADLEVYSDDPADLSTMDYPAFLEAYREIIRKACAQLQDNRFACFVVGEVRDRRGNYYDFVGDTVQAFKDAGLAYYNEAILVTMVGSLPIRVGKQFAGSRKLGKTHQNVLVFVKGDAKKAAQACGDVDVEDAIEEVAGDH